MQKYYKAWALISRIYYLGEELTLHHQVRDFFGKKKKKKAGSNVLENVMESCLLSITRSKVLKNFRG